VSLGFVKNQRLRTWVYWRDYNDSLVDPTEVYLDVKDPDSNVTTFQMGVDPEMTNPSTGYYLFESVDLDDEGTWYLRWRAEGTYQSAVELRIIVRESAF